MTDTPDLMQRHNALNDLLQDLADEDPSVMSLDTSPPLAAVIADSDDVFELTFCCRFCGSTGNAPGAPLGFHKPLGDLSVHAVSCAWRRARELTR